MSPGVDDGVMPAADFAERMQFFRPRRPEQPVPGVGAKRHDTGQPALEVTEADRTQERGQIAAKRPHGGTMFRPGVHRHDKKDGGARKLSNHRLWDSRWHVPPFTDPDRRQKSARI